MWFIHRKPSLVSRFPRPSRNQKRKGARRDVRRWTHLSVERLEDRRLFSAGALDPTFGVGGKVLTDFPGPVNAYANSAAVIQPSGDLVAVGTTQGPTGYGFALTEYKPDGTLDPAFGISGEVVMNFGAFYYEFASAVAAQADGKIVVAGQAGGDFFLLRFNPDGSLDSGFGTNGTVRTDFENDYDAAYDVAIQPDGKIVAVGTATVQLPGFPQGVHDEQFAVVRYNPDGSLDPSFGASGKFHINLQFGNFGGPDVAQGVALQPDDKILVVGSSWNRGFAGGVSNNFTTLRLNPNGTLDTSFSGGGINRIDFSTAVDPLNDANSDDFAQSVAVQADGKIVVAGYTATQGFWRGTPVKSNFVLVRYNPDGTLDTSFNGNGELMTDFGGTNDRAFDVALQTGGKIIAAGQAGSNFGLARYNPDGSLDAGFGAAGKVVTDFGGSTDAAFSMALFSDGKIVAAGRAGLGFALARYNTDGSLDPSFDGSGKLTTAFVGPGTDVGQDVIVSQTDGKILVAGVTYNAAGTDIALARYATDGSLDSTFGATGRVTTEVASLYGRLAGVVVESDGRIVVAGWSNGAVLLARYNPDGSLDNTFGTGGLLFSQPGFYFVPDSIALESDGKILLAGYTYQPATGPDFGVVRYNPDGSVDTNFGTAGRATADFGNTYDFANALAIQSDGKIVVAGWVIGFNNSGYNYDFAVARFNADGTPDTRFGTSGKTVTDFGSPYDQANAIALEPDGKIVLSGFTANNVTGYDFALVRYTADGKLDDHGNSPFGVKGIVTTNFTGTSFDVIRAIAIQGNGKIVAVGTAENVFGLARYNPDGSLDATFGSGGLATTDFTGGPAGASAVALQADGKIVAAGNAYNGSNSSDFALARYLGDQISPQDNINTLIAQVSTLVGYGVLNQGQGNALTAKLIAALTSINSAKSTAAINQLNAFINQVNAFVQSGILTSAQAQPLISAASEVIAAIDPSGAHLMNEGSDGASTFADVQPVTDAGELVSGIIGMYLENADGTPVTSEEQARFDDAINTLNVAFGSYGIDLVDVGPGDAAQAIIQVEVAAGCPAGGAADGVLGCTVAGQITLVTGWDWYTGADFGAIGSSQYDFETIVMHELGHAIGLGHSGDTGSVMYPYLAPGQARRSLTAQDLSVIEGSPGTTPEPLLAAGFAGYGDRAHLAPAPVSPVKPSSSQAATPAALAMNVLRGSGGGLSAFEIAGVPLAIEGSSPNLAAGNSLDTLIIAARLQVQPGGSPSYLFPALAGFSLTGAMNSGGGDSGAAEEAIDLGSWLPESEAAGDAPAPLSEPRVPDSRQQKLEGPPNGLLLWGAPGEPLGSRFEPMIEVTASDAVFAALNEGNLGAVSGYEQSSGSQGEASGAATAGWNTNESGLWACVASLAALYGIHAPEYLRRANRSLENQV